MVEGKFTKYWVNEMPKNVFVALYLLANAAVFVQSFLEYKNNKELFPVLSYGVCIAKGSAATIKLNCACILIPVLRNFLSWVRGTWINTYIPVDKNIVFHKLIAWLIAIGTAIHSVAHFWNFLQLSNVSLPVAKQLGFASVPTVWYLSYESLPGLTGHLAILVMVIMYTTAIESIRRPQYELFYYTHYLFIVFMCLNAVHGALGLFGTPSFWYWVVGPLFLYLVEKMVRFLRGKQTTMLLVAKQHPSRVLELRMKKNTFSYKPGQYIYLNCPYISKHEWHPFTITSAPDEDFVSVHINIVGNWTGKIADFLNKDKKLGVVQQDLLEAPDGSKILAIDGPYGTASEEVFKYNTVMLIGAGIGVTPFASVLKHIKFQLQKQNSSDQKNPPLQKVYFYWICRDKNSFEWFSSMLSALEEENVNNFLEINTYLTGNLTPDEVRNVMFDTENQKQDQITGLSSPTHVGRPKWPNIFQEMVKSHPGGKIGVFFCGPRMLSKQLYNNCRKYTNNECQFRYHKENF